jgi:hypothetical protein
VKATELERLGSYRGFHLSAVADPFAHAVAGFARVAGDSSVGSPAAGLVFSVSRPTREEVQRRLCELIDEELGPVPHGRGQAPPLHPRR